MHFQTSSPRKHCKMYDHALVRLKVSFKNSGCDRMVPVIIIFIYLRSAKSISQCMLRECQQQMLTSIVRKKNHNNYL